MDPIRQKANRRTRGFAPMAVQIKNIRIKKLALLKIAAERVETAGTDETHEFPT